MVGTSDLCEAVFFVDAVMRYERKERFCVHDDKVVVVAQSR
jgi:hypothetical protein